MRYHSTRGHAPHLSFEEVVLTGLAPDGGLYLPETLPHFSIEEQQEMRGMSYQALACRLIHPFMDELMDAVTLRTLIDETYSEFRHPAIAPLKQIDQKDWVLELFHGPTLAFKDFALQCLGRIVSYILQKRGEKVVVLGATSGDTGSAAIAGCQGQPNMNIVILFPNGHVSEVQRRQMTTIADANVHCVALDGTFDDCQHIVKTLFVDAAFKAKHRLVAVNSINWTRILAQIVYYAYASLSLGAPEKPVGFSVPTGNFGDIYAGYLAKKMGFPVADLIIATNRNDILHRCVQTGAYAMQGVTPTLSPSMDIEISSNFERLLFDLHAQDARAVASLMHTLRTDKQFTLGASVHAALKATFSSAAIDDEATKATIASVYNTTGEILDPHTAIGVAAAKACRLQGDIPSDIPIVTLATAHPAKFPEAVEQACGIHPALPTHLHDLFDRQERSTILENKAEAIKSFINAL